MAVIIIKDTHRGLWYENGVLLRVVEAGRYRIPRAAGLFGLLTRFRPRVEIALVDMRERDLTIKGQEILTSDKVAIRVSIVVRFRVRDPRAAMHEVEEYEARLYTDVQLAARRSLASMPLEEILTNRNRLSEDILAEVKESAAGYGTEIIRADVKDLIFPGNLQMIMNRVLEAERTAEARLVEARTQSSVERLEAETQSVIDRTRAEAEAEITRVSAEAEAESQRIKTAAEVRDLREREGAAAVYSEHPALLRLLELETLQEMSRMANARIYIKFDPAEAEKENER